MSVRKLNQLDGDELNILATAIANLVNTPVLCKVKPDAWQPEKTTYRIACADGKKRDVSQNYLVDLLAKLAGLAGEDVTQVAREIRQEANRR